MPYEMNCPWMYLHFGNGHCNSPGRKVMVLLFRHQIQVTGKQDNNVKPYKAFNVSALHTQKSKTKHQPLYIPTAKSITNSVNTQF